jgi:hypothetical protein
MDFSICILNFYVKKHIKIAFIPDNFLKKKKYNLIANVCVFIVKGLFESVVVVAFQIIFHAEMHQNNIFF